MSHSRRHYGRHPGEYTGRTGTPPRAEPRSVSATCSRPLPAPPSPRPPPRAGGSGALARLNARGVPVPDEISLVGFDDLVFAAISAPPLTTIAMPTEAAGRAAVTILLDLLDGEADERANQVLDTYLIVRATTAPPAG